MRPHPRIRKTVKWGGVSTFAMLLAVWAASWVWYVHWGWANGDGIGVYEGSLHVEIGPNIFNDPAVSGWDAGELIAAPRSMTYRSGRPFLASPAVPLWIPAILSLTASMVAAAMDFPTARRANLGACPKCSYSRAGLAADAVCPECGSPARAPSSPA